MLVLLFLLFQGKQISFEPVQSGMPVQLGTFNMTVPEGLLFASGSDAEYMMELFRANNIPNCQGIFFSKAEDWSFCGLLVLLPFQNFAFDNVLPPEIFIKNFKETHLFYSAAVTDPATNVIAPTLDPNENSFVLGMEYTDPGMQGIFIKKVWLSAQDTLIMVVKANTSESYYRNLPAIDAMLASVTQNDDVESLPIHPSSFLKLYGMTPASDEKTNESMPLSVVIASILLCITGIGLLIFAVRLQKKSSSEANPTGGESASARTADSQSNEIVSASE